MICLLITDSNDLDFNININQSFQNIIAWFNSNLLILNFNKTHYVEFRTKNCYQLKTKVKYEHTNTSNSTKTKFWGLIIDKTLSWNQHIDQTATKLCSACYALWNLKHTVPQSTLSSSHYKAIYISHLSHAYHMTSPCHSPWSAHPNNMWQEVKSCS